MIDERVFLYKNTFENDKLLKKSNKCVCIYCKKKFTYEDIKEWIKEEQGLTALCPCCDVDAVMPLFIDNNKIDEDTIDFLHVSHFE